MGDNWISPDDAELVPLSAIQHFSYCPRQCALIHMEQVFDENIFTMKGRWAHTHVDEEHVKSAQGNQIITALPVWSDAYGLTGKCDVVEIIDGVPYPVEFKHGRRKAQIYDELQLCAQAMCLEEMFGVPVLEGAIYHISSKRRRKVVLGDELRRQVVVTAGAIREMRRQSTLPSAVNDARCNECSLEEACLPTWTDGGHAGDADMWEQILSGLEEEETKCILP